jgi:hypothetical protein
MDINKIISIIRNLKEDGGGPGGAAIANSANAPGSGGSLGANSPNKNMQGLDPVMGEIQKRKYATGGRGSRKNWLPKKSK